MSLKNGWLAEKASQKVKNFSKESIQFWVRNHEAHYQLGLTEEHLGNLKAAFKHFEMAQALGRNPELVRKKLSKITRKLMMDAYLKKEWRSVLEYGDHFKIFNEVFDPLLDSFYKKAQKKIKKEN